MTLLIQNSPVLVHIEDVPRSSIMSALMAIEVQADRGTFDEEQRTELTALVNGLRSSLDEPTDPELSDTWQFDLQRNDQGWNLEIHHHGEAVLSLKEAKDVWISADEMTNVGRLHWGLG